MAEVARQPTVLQLYLMDLHPDENPVVCCFPILHSIQPWRLCDEELINYDYIEDKDGIIAITYCIKADDDRMDGGFDLGGCKITQK